MKKKANPEDYSRSLYSFFVEAGNGLSLHRKADTMLHEATNIAQLILLELELIDGRSVELDRSLAMVEQLVLKQNQLILDTRRQLRRIAPADSEDFRGLSH